MGVTLKNYQMPMDPDYRPEIDNSLVLSEDLISKYRMLVGGCYVGSLRHPICHNHKRPL